MAAPRLVCPVSRQPLRRIARSEADRAAESAFAFRNRAGSATFPLPDEVLVREDNQGAYPVVDEIPILLVPEMLTPGGIGDAPDVHAGRYAEAYDEMAFYADWSGTDATEIDRLAERLARLASLSDSDKDSFPEPATRWMDRGNTVGAAFAAYQHLGAVRGCVTLQLGGRGTHAVKFLLAGADVAVVVSPVVEELRFANALSTRLGLNDRLTTVCALGEEMPFEGGEFDAIYSGSSMHHTVTSESFPEMQRLLAEGGRFASVDIWRAPLYSFGTRVFGRATPGIHCQPLDPGRLQPALDSFDTVDASMHGAVARYPLSVLSRAGWSPSVDLTLRLARAEDRLGRRFTFVGRQASIVGVHGERQHADRTAG